MLKTLRKRNNLTQRNLAAQSGISQSYICKLEKDSYNHSPTIKQIVALSKALKIDPLQLTKWFLNMELKNIRKYH